MTVDELVSLLEDLTSSTDLSDVRTGNVDLVHPANLDDDNYLTLVRFIGGERPLRTDRGVVQEPSFVAYEVGRLPGSVRTVTPERDPNKPLDLKGDFDGVSLP